jgi:hypothetical protein
MRTTVLASDCRPRFARPKRHLCTGVLLFPLACGISVLEDRGQLRGMFGQSCRRKIEASVWGGDIEGFGVFCEWGSGSLVFGVDLGFGFGVLF